MITKGCLVQYSYEWAAAHGEIYLAISDPYRGEGETWVDVLYEGRTVRLYRERLKRVSQ